jgi:hypothetical protein
MYIGTPLLLDLDLGQVAKPLTIRALLALEYQPL